MTVHRTIRDSAGPVSAQDAATEDLARLVEAIARSTDTAPDKVLAGMSDDVLAGVFLVFLVRAHRLRDARPARPRRSATAPEADPRRP
ncbi:hypothetical protein ACIP98_04490 [Streptomyces sp. NPDC088354]|uniref:hypothetical protein n=1 Tax=unclassified Streptomyces TaxID=2593676 RepID=UPI0029AD99AA|nr:hypothetical protein [Streptomyces sp. MI02-7b]MDX3070898.1 hypothetical protein [Streptomyces sp. MI02-7b]